MSLSAGSQLGPFQIVSPLGKGGMGEVWLANDPRLGRDVAIKVLPPEFTLDAERLARFDREARLLASLNHPHIASIYGLEESDGKKFLVMELVGGETLAERASRGAIPVDEAIAIAIQTAEALETAHDKGIVHRDLKPANIMVDHEGNVRVLDFGLAKGLDNDSATDADITNSPTMVRAATGAGVILGTAAYMSPEQARGKRVDRRADIWAFGVVLWEMLTGRRMFQGETVSDTLAAVLTAPVDLETLPSETPPAVHWILSRCLTRNPKHRLRDIGEARVLLEQGLPEVISEQPTAGKPSRPRRSAAAVIALAFLGGMLLTFLWSRYLLPDTTGPRVVRASIGVEPAEGVDLGSSLDSKGIAISPDGAMIAFSGAVEGERDVSSRIFVRHLSQPVASPLPNTNGGRPLFFTHDGHSIGFEYQEKLFLIPVSGGSPREVAIPSMELVSASSARDGSLIAAVLTEDDRSAIVRIHDHGDRIETIREFEDDARVTFPSLLPGERGLLYTRFNFSSEALLELVDLSSGEAKIIHPDGAIGSWSDSGHILIATQGRLDALPFDLQALAPTGPPITIRTSLSAGFIYGFSQFALSRSGTLITIAADAIQPRSDALQWLGPGARPEPLGAPAAYYADPRISPDGRFVAVSIPTEENDIWIRDIVRGTQSRLSFAPGEEESPVWSPDGRSVYWAAQRGDARKLLRRNADGSGNEEELWSDPRHYHLADVSPDGSTILIDVGNPGTGVDVAALDLREPTEGARPLLEGSYAELLPRISPDGDWLVYVSNESGRPEVYLQPYPSLDRKIQLSDEGGLQPLWSKVGSTLFYRSGQRIMAVDLTGAATTLTASKPRVILDQEIGFGKGFRHWGYDVAPDDRFLVTPVESEFFPRRIDITFGLFEELASLNPSR